VLPEHAPRLRSDTGSEYPRLVQTTGLTPPEQRVLGCLIEKRFTTPDQYPLSLNALRLACNQSTNRDPVTAYDEAAVREAAQLLCRRGIARLASGHTSRAIKYRHLAEEALSLGREQLALLAVLLLRGAQTPGELKGRSERMAHIETLAEVEALLEALVERGLVRRLERRPGQKEDRFEHRLGQEPATAGPSGAAASASGPEPQPARPAAPPAQAPGGADAGIAAFGAAGEALGASGRPGGERNGAAVLAGDTPEEAGPWPNGDSGTGSGQGDLAARVAALEAEVAALRAELGALRPRGL
jgi:uncharacterized protein YceH (UPF0502 family)